MNKLIFISIASFLSIIVIILMFIMLALQTRKEELATARPTPLPTLSPTFIPDKRPTALPTVVSGPELAVVATYPSDQTIDFPIHNAYIEVTFNKPAAITDYIFSMEPSAKYITQQPKREVVRYMFREPLLPNTLYRFRINTLKLLPVTITFTTQVATDAAGVQ